VSFLRSHPSCLFFFFFYIVCVCVCVCECMCMCECECMGEGSIVFHRGTCGGHRVTCRGVCLLFCHVDVRNQTQISRLGSRCLSQLSQLSGPTLICCCLRQGSPPHPTPDWNSSLRQGWQPQSCTGPLSTGL